MTITIELIEAGRSCRGGWSKQQFKLLGVPWPPERGWIKTRLGYEIEDHKAAEFMALKDEHLRTKPGKERFYPREDKHSDRDQSALDFANSLYESQREDFSA